MAFENKGQYNFGAKQAYSIIGGYNKVLREKGISSQEEENKMKQVPQTAQQSGFGKF